MRFLYRALHDLFDAQRNFEQLEQHGIWDDTQLGGILSGTLPDPSAAANALHQLGIARGVATINFATSTAATQISPSHGLSGTPTSVVATMNHGSFGGVVSFYTSNFTGSTFDLNGTSSVAITGNVLVNWIAVL